MILYVILLQISQILYIFCDSILSLHERIILLENEILTIEEVAIFLRVSERTVYDWAQKGKIPCGRLGSSWRFQRSEIMKWISNKLGTTNNNLTKEPIIMEQILTPERCTILECQNKESALNQLIAILSQTNEVTSESELREAIFHRESLMSTGIGLGIGIPHARIPSVSSIVMALGVCKNALMDYNALDDKPVNVLVMVAAGKNQHSKYIRLLSILCSRLKNPEIRNKLIQAQEIDELYRSIII